MVRRLTSLANVSDPFGAWLGLTDKLLHRCKLTRHRHGRRDAIAFGQLHEARADHRYQASLVAAEPVAFLAPGLQFGGGRLVIAARRDQRFGQAANAVDDVSR